jgi:hypothetical protein
MGNVEDRGRPWTQYYRLTHTPSLHWRTVKGTIVPSSVSVPSAFADLRELLTSWHQLSKPSPFVCSPIMDASETMDNVRSSDSEKTKVDNLAVSIRHHLTEAALVRKIDWRIVPTLFLAYFLQFLDKVAINVRYDGPVMIQDKADEYSM